MVTSQGPWRAAIDNAAQANTCADESPSEPPPLALILYWPVRWFARLKARRRDLAWLKYL
jgi:hypothetical protein